MLERLRRLGKRSKDPRDEDVGESAESSRQEAVEAKLKVFPSLRQLVVPCTGKETDLEVPQEVLDTLKAWQERGITNFDIYHLLAHKFEQDGDYPGWEIKPKAWFWRQIQVGSVSPDVATLDDIWVAVDSTQKPNYDRGRQQYPSDPFANLLEKLRREGKVKVPIEYKHVPQDSRFAILPEDLTEHVLPGIEELLEVKADQVRFPKAIELNLIGNRSHPEWGQTNTWERFVDELVSGRRLIGGNSDDGGLANVYGDWFGTHGDLVGFRPVVVFPSKT